MKKIVLVIVLGVAVGLVSRGYGQFYEPEHLWHCYGEESNDNFGHHIAGIGDVNGDGCEDFLASTKTHVYPSEGYIMLFYGGDPPDTIPDLLFHNPYPYGFFALGAENVGDLNGDQWDDFTIGGGYEQDNIERVFIYFGGVLFDTIPDVVLSEATSYDAFGSIIQGLGDVNGDGYDDMAVWAANYGNGSGKMWVYFGGNPMDSIADWSQQGVRPQVFYGLSIAGNGDLNGDGYDDFAIYEWTGYPNLAQTTYYIYFGGAFLDTIPDVTIHGEDYYPEIDISDPSALLENLNGDEYSDLVLGAGRTCIVVVFYGGNPMDTQIDLVLSGLDPNPPLWEMTISAAGDVNHDGYGDLIVAQLEAYGYSGLVVVYLGSPWMTGQPDMEWTGLFQPWEGCGKSLEDCGDINGDGVDDVMFHSFDGNFNNRGCVDIWSGDTDFVVRAPKQTTAPVPSSFHLLPPYPNPFNSKLTIPFEIVPGLANQVSLKIYNILGQEVADLTGEVQRHFPATKPLPWQVTWSGQDKAGKDCSSGIYLIMLQWGNNSQVQKAVLLR